MRAPASRSASSARSWRTLANNRSVARARSAEAWKEPAIRSNSASAVNAVSKSAAIDSSRSTRTVRVAASRDASSRLATRGRIAGRPVAISLAVAASRTSKRSASKDLTQVRKISNGGPGCVATGSGGTSAARTARHIAINPHARTTEFLIIALPLPGTYTFPTHKSLDKHWYTQPSWPRDVLLPHAPVLRSFPPVATNYQAC